MPLHEIFEVVECDLVLTSEACGEIAFGFLFFNACIITSQKVLDVLCIEISFATLNHLYSVCLLYR